jgi:hypothetical protein
VKIEKVLEKFLACKGVLKIQICSRKNRKFKKSKKWWKVNIRYVPIYLRQGLIILSLMSGTFLLLLLPLFGLSWRIGRRRTRDLTPHLICMYFLLDRVAVGSSGWGSGAPPEWAPVVSLLNHKLPLLPVEKFKEYIVDPDAELDFSGSDIDPSLHAV